MKDDQDEITHLNLRCIVCLGSMKPLNEKTYFIKMNQRWRRRLHDEVTCHWLCQLTPWLVPDPITWLSIAAHPPTLGSLRPVPVGSQHHIITDFLTTLSQVSLETMRTENMSENSQKNPFEKADWRVLPGLAAILRHLAASGKSGLVTSC